MGMEAANMKPRIIMGRIRAVGSALASLSSKLSLKRSALDPSSETLARAGEIDIPLGVVRRILSFVACTKDRTCSGEVRQIYNADEAKAQDTFLACSLVSRAWREVTLPFLYHTLGMYCDPRGEPAFRPFRGRIRQPQDFLGFLIEFPHIQPCIRELRLSRPLGNVRPDDIYAAAVRHPSYDIIVMAEIVERLPRLRVLHVQSVYFHYFYLPIRSALPRPLERFEYIANISPVQEMGPPFAALLSLFSDVKVLYLYGLTFRPMESNTSSCRPDLRYETLHLIKSSGLDMFARMFRSVLVSGGTETLSLSYWGENSSNSGAEKELWRAVSPSLLNVTLIFNVGPHRSTCSAPAFGRVCLTKRWIDPDIYKLDITRCTRLKSMTLEVLLSSEDTHDEHTWLAIVQILSRLPACPHLRQVAIRVVLHHWPSNTLAQLLAEPEGHIENIEDALLKLKEMKVDVSVAVRYTHSAQADAVLTAAFAALFPRVFDS
ncbi:hypothetical protein NM688_g8950 [Phlebia brevispora]|uniref:Uncharacterized protein n=1 Tax=Phlebia brevispora TaxID=194682 RepID=A0ACC1RMC8_9APHY|nr:hypothetical protein NM688_g8950 [Phlebia brevispora]